MTTTARVTRYFANKEFTHKKMLYLLKYDSLLLIFLPNTVLQYTNVFIQIIIKAQWHGHIVIFGLKKVPLLSGKKVTSWSSVQYDMIIYGSCLPMLPGHYWPNLIKPHPHSPVDQLMCLLNNILLTEIFNVILNIWRMLFLAHRIWQWKQWKR